MAKSTEKAKNKKIRVVAYCRVSTGNSEQKQSFEAQQAYYLAKFADNGYTVAPTGLLHRKKEADKVIEGIYADEGISGTSTKNRVAFMQMVEDAKRGLFDMIFVKSTSRFARNTEEGIHYCKELAKYNVAVLFEDYNISSLSPDKDFEIGLFFGLAQKESQTKSYNVKWGVRRSQEKGTWVTQASFGYNKVGNNLEINEAEAEVVKEIFRLYLEEGYGFAKIASHLQANGVPTKRSGASWRMNTVKDMLSNPVYKGELRTHTIEADARVTEKRKKVVPEEEHIVHHREDLRILSDEIWQLAQDQKALRSAQMGQGGKPSRKYKYSSFLYCYACGSAYRAKKIWRHKQAPQKYEVIPVEYSCSTRDTYRKGVMCPTVRRVAIRETKVEEIVSRHIKSLQADKSYLEELFKLYLIVTRGFPLSEEEIKGLYAKRDDITLEIKAILKRMVEKDTNIYDDMLEDLEDELAKVNETIAKAETREEAIKADYERYKEFIQFVDEIDPEDFSRLDMQRIFTKAEVIDFENDLEDKLVIEGLPVEGIGLLFEYNIFNMPLLELYDRAIALGYPHLLELRIERV